MARILIVDDEPEIAKLYATGLCLRGYDAVAATSGADALTAYEMARADDKPFDLVILDIGMPFKNGYEVGERLHSISPKLPIIFLTAFDEDYNPEREALSEPIAHLTKPMVVPELAEAVEGALAR